ncbi:MAG: hemerythrin domain-containing protein [Bdellovibrionota bacterium]
MQKQQAKTGAYGALELLMEDHQKMRGLLERIRVSADQHEKLIFFEHLKHEVALHFSAEEMVLYPAVSEYDDLGEFVEDAYEEHLEINDLIDEISDAEDNGETMEEDFEELAESIECHVEREEDEFFVKARKTLPSFELQRLAGLIEEVKRQGSKAA